MHLTYKNNCFQYHLNNNVRNVSDCVIKYVPKLKSLLETYKRAIICFLIATILDNFTLFRY